MFKPRRGVMLAARAVRDDVMAATHGQQTPFAYGSLGGGDIFLAK
jgi:hypothetical protein